MSIINLKQYLEKIIQGKPVNYPVFKKLVESNTPYQVSSKSVQIQKERGDLYKVKFLSDELKDSLNRLAGLDVTSRVSLATQNKSHSQKVSGSMINCRRGEEHPYVVLVEKSGDFTSPYEYPNHTDCLIVENLENFLFIKDTINCLESNPEIDFKNLTDTIFSAGNAITNSFHKLFLNQFSRVFLLLDLDLGGLKTAASLKKMLSEKEVHFLIAPNTDKLLSEVVSEQKPEYLIKIETIGQKNPFLYEAASLIRKHRKTVEQEAYLQ